jgi:hypothetical protein
MKRWKNLFSLPLSLKENMSRQLNTKKIMFYTLRFWSDQLKMRPCYKLCFQRPFENNSEVAPPHSKNCNDEESIDRDNFNHLEEQQATNV